MEDPVRGTLVLVTIVEFVGNAPGVWCVVEWPMTKTQVQIFAGVTGRERITKTHVGQRAELVLFPMSKQIEEIRLH
ncbi:hypothetical protein HY419_02270 [candidate division WWE3 bacterium]|nr:hypothetical protein [candidate division WWE3 bacterium]